MKCPYCGAETMKNICEFCGSELPMGKNQTTVHITNNYYGSESNTAKIVQDQEKAPKSKTHLGIWILGWVCIFPIPLTVLMLRNQKLKPLLKYILIAIAWVAYLVIAINGNSNNNSTQTHSNNTNLTENSSNASGYSEMNTEFQTETPVESVFFENNEVINQFITDYQTIAGYEMNDIQQGNISQKCFCYAGNCYIEILDSLDTTSENVNISIHFENCEQEEILAVTRNCLKVFGATDEEIQKTITDFTVNNDENYMIEGYNTNTSIICTYIPTKELSNGNSFGRIDISSSTYGK